MLVVQIKTLQYTLVVIVSRWLIDFYRFDFIERKGERETPAAVLLMCALIGWLLHVPWPGWTCSLGAAGWRSPVSCRPGLCSVLGIYEWPLVRSRLDKMCECKRPPLGGENTNNAACSNPLLSEQICVCFQNYFRVHVCVPFCGFTQFLLCVLIRKPSHLYFFFNFIFSSSGFIFLFFTFVSLVLLEPTLEYGSR